MRSVVLCVALLSCALAQGAAPQPPSVAARSWMVGDLSSGQMLAAQKPDERVDPASLTKLMTAYVVYGALREKKLSPEQTVQVSERAWKAAGSRMFVQPRLPVS